MMKKLISNLISRSSLVEQLKAVQFDDAGLLKIQEVSLAGRSQISTLIRVVY